MRTELLTIDDLVFVIFHYEDDDLQMLNEAKTKGRPLVGNYSYDIHQPHNPTGDYHLHLYDRNNQILSLNKTNGKAHDGYSGTRIPNKAFHALKARLPDWKWPDNQILESQDYFLFMEANHREQLRKVRVSANVEGNESVKPWEGYFHRFADDSFLAGGGRGYVSKKVALIEDENGHIIKIAMNGFMFLNG